MEIKKYHRIYPVLVFLLFLTIAKAQQKDFQCWPSAEIALEVLKNMDVHIEEEIRFKENCSQLKRQINDVGISYKINKYVKTALFYRVEANWKNPQNHQWRHGIYADLAFRYSSGRFQFGYRVRFQTPRIEFNGDEDRLRDDLVNRHKLTVKYNIKNLPLTPFAEGELFYLLHDRQYDLSDYRTWIGLTYSPGKIHEFSLKYGIDQELMKADPLTAYILAFTYTVNLKL